MMSERRFTLVLVGGLTVFGHMITPALAQPPTIDDGDIGVVNDDLILRDRDLVIKDANGRDVLRLDAQSGDIIGSHRDGTVIFRLERRTRDLWLGGHFGSGDLLLVPRGRSGQDPANASIHLRGEEGIQTLGGAGTTGQLVLRNGNGQQRVSLSGATGDLVLGQSGADGDVFVRDAGGNPTVTLNGADGQVSAGQIVSNHASSAGGIDSASLYLDSADPALGLRDRSGGNTRGWLIQSGSTGRLSFNTGDLSGVGSSVFVLNPDGSVCIGAC